jgi:hypothetical protein
MALSGIDEVIRVARSHPHLRLVIEDPCESMWDCWTMLGLHRELPNVQIHRAEEPAHRPGTATSSTVAVAGPVVGDAG